MAEITKKQITQLSKALADRYHLLQGDVVEELKRSGNERYIDIAGRVRDLGDDSVAATVADLGAAIVDRQVREMRDIEAAQRRIRENTYGICTDCGNDIGFERLQAYPTAKRCIVCQEKKERLYAGGETPSL